MDCAQHCALLDEAQDKIVVLDDTGTYQYVNGAVRRILGYDPDDLVGDATFDYIHPRDRERVRTAFFATADGSVEPAGIEYRHRTADGGWRWLESRMADHSNSEIGGYVVSSRDITERKEAEFARRETETRLEEIAANTSEVLWMFTADWSEVLFLNDAFESLYGLSPSALDDDPEAFLDAVHPDDRERVRTAMARLSAGETVDIEYRVNEAQDYSRWVWVRGVPVVEHGDVARVTGFSRDITDRRRRERQLQVMDRLLRHNLRNELNVVIGRAELAAENGSPDVREHTTAIERICRSILATAEKERDIVNLLSQAGTRVTFDLVDTVHAAVASVEQEYPNANVAVCAPEEALVVGVAGFDLAAVEFIENAAAHATGAEPSVDVSVRIEEQMAALTVADRGPPIPSEDIDVLLGDREADALSHGSGLGFWLVRWAVELSDGSVSLDRTESGNEITVRLPVPST